MPREKSSFWNLGVNIIKYPPSSTGAVTGVKKKTTGGGMTI